MFSLFVRSPSFTLIGSGSMQWHLEEGFVGIFLYSTVVCSLKSEGKLAGHEKWMHSSSLNHSAVERRCLKFLFFFLFLFPSEFNEKKQKKIYFKKDTMAQCAKALADPQCKPGDLSLISGTHFTKYPLTFTQDPSVLHIIHTCTCVRIHTHFKS